MKNKGTMIFIALLCTACIKEEPQKPSQDFNASSKKEVARIIANMGMGSEQLYEVHDAVNSSNANGYDEEYTLSSLFTTPGAGVGEKGGSATKASRYNTPMKDLFRKYLENSPVTKSGADNVEEYILSLTESDLQIYWPYSEDWNGKDYPVITFDPGYGAESNYGYEISKGKDGRLYVRDSVLVDEDVARSRPVWVINTNDDSAFSPLEMYCTNTTDTKANAEGRRSLVLKDFKMLRNYDSWFGGASEFFIKIGAVDGFKASTDEDLKLYSPSVTDFMLVVKRKELGKTIPLDIFLLNDVTDQMDKVAFIVVEDDGGKVTNWKCSATVKYNSRSYGFEIDIPYKDKDDIVWRGQLPVSYFQEGEEVPGRFGDVQITFGLK